MLNRNRILSLLVIAYVMCILMEITEQIACSGVGNSNQHTATTDTYTFTYEKESTLSKYYKNEILVSFKLFSNVHLQII